MRFRQLNLDAFTLGRLIFLRLLRKGCGYFNLTTLTEKANSKDNEYIDAMEREKKNDKIIILAVYAEN